MELQTIDNVELEVNDLSVEALRELNSLELALVGGGSGDVAFV